MKKDVGRETSNTCLVEERLYPNLKPKKVHPGLKGVCSSLLERVSIGNTVVGRCKIKE